MRAEGFDSVQESLHYLEHRFDLYPLFREMMGLFGDHSGETLLDYGCGPGNDLVGFAVHARPAHVIGVDVSHKALRLAAERLELHGVGSDRVELVQISDSSAALPIRGGVSTTSTARGCCTTRAIRSRSCVSFGGCSQRVDAAA